MDGPFAIIGPKAGAYLPQLVWVHSWLKTELKLSMLTDKINFLKKNITDQLENGKIERYPIIYYLNFYGDKK